MTATEWTAAAVGQTSRARRSLDLRQARAWGLPGAIGACALLAGAASAFLWLPGLRDETQRLDAELDRAHRLAGPTASRAHAPAATPMPPAARFLDSFPKAATRQARLAALLGHAEAHHLPPAQSELRLVREADLALLRYEMRMPLAGRYADIRAFIEDAQRDDPALALVHLQLHRDAAHPAEVQAELEWVFFMQPEAATGGEPERQEAPR